MTVKILTNKRNWKKRILENAATVRYHGLFIFDKRFFFPREGKGEECGYSKLYIYLERDLNVTDRAEY